MPPSVSLYRWDELALEKVTEMISRKIVTGEREMLAQVREPLLSVLRISPDFRPAYDPLLRMAHGISASDAAAARALFTELATLQPARAEAAEALRTLVASQ